MAGADPVWAGDAAEDESGSAGAARPYSGGARPALPGDLAADRSSAVGHRPSEKTRALDQVLASVRGKWGHGSIVRLDEVLAPARDTSSARLRRGSRRREAPPWWPVVLPGAAVARPHVLEVTGEAGSGRLTLALAWLEAARPALAAFIDSAGCFYPPAAAGMGVSLETLIVVRPPADTPRTALDALAVLLRSEAFDVIVCPLPTGARISLTFASKLATLASRSGTSLLLLSQGQGLVTQGQGSGVKGQGGSPRRWAPPFSVIRGSEDIPPLHRVERGLGGEAPSERGVGGEADPERGLRGEGIPERESQRDRIGGVLGAFADARVRITGRRWLWEHGELAGLKLHLTTERARSAATTTPELVGTSLVHEMTCRFPSIYRVEEQRISFVALPASPST